MISCIFKIKITNAEVLSIIKKITAETYQYERNFNGEIKLSIIDDSNVIIQPFINQLPNDFLEAFTKM